MRVTVRVPLDIDVDAWEVAYGVDRTKIREDVNEHVRNSIISHLDDLGLLLRIRRES